MADEDPLRLRDGVQASLARNQQSQTAFGPPSWRGSRNQSKEGGRGACRSSGHFSLLNSSTGPLAIAPDLPGGLEQNKSGPKAKPKSRKVSRPLGAELFTVQPGLTLTDGIRRRRGRDAGKKPSISSGLAHDQDSQEDSLSLLQSYLKRNSNQET